MADKKNIISMINKKSYYFRWQIRNFS
uniref:Uncharacterized protein n=1 Tax=Arundo donax TaxID=35708 RepID=A0A0A9HR81_ARUDO